ncbi:Uncharacterized protein APZ42_030985 [Daphnia magna]|uniref:Uncharacterized protein n=1 Tax=Daphnia magna TaxID=35525 RepID=A0A162DCE0_9CRUS|nr:Uncharacterized protein APZ42_030985 [Daphnia magna]
MCMWYLKKIKSIVLWVVSRPHFTRPPNGYPDVIRSRQCASITCDSKSRTKHTVIPPTL